jgi:hypothetical protein
MIRISAAINTIIPAREPVIKIEAPKKSVKMILGILVIFKMGKKHKGKVRQTEIANALGWLDNPGNLDPEKISELNVSVLTFAMPINCKICVSELIRTPVIQA